MKKSLFYLFVLVIVTNIANAGAYQLKYRVECAKSTDKDLLHVINKIPELKKFMMPNGMEVYFSGEYFGEYPEAKSRLEEVQKLGFKNAFIRVFKYRQMLSKSAGDKYIEKVELLIDKQATKVVASKESQSVRHEKKEDLRKRFKGRTYGSREEVQKMLAARKKKKEEETAKNQALILAKRESKEERLEEKKEEVEADGVVDEAPIFKVLLAKTYKEAAMPKSVEALADEVVYSYEEGKSRYYAVGFYDDANTARSSLKNYKKYAEEKPVVVGLYKGRIISMKLAEQLHGEYKKLHGATVKM